MKLVQKVARVIDVNPRKEHHGENLALAVDVKLTVNCEKDVLDQFDKQLGDFLFGKNGPRFPELGAVDWGREYEHSLVKIHKLELKDCTVKKISLKPEQGDSVKVTFTATLYPSVKTVGELAQLIQEEVLVDVEQTQSDLVDESKKS